MDISSRYTGTPLRAYTSLVSWRQTMNYAAAVLDDNPRYFDDEGKSRLIAPPMFAVSVTWPIIERLPSYLDAKDFPYEAMLTQVHYTEHLQFHRPIAPGDRLTIHGKIAAILPHKAGTLSVLRFDARDDEGRPVFTEHMGGLMRGVTCIHGGKGMDDLPPVPEPPREDRTGWEALIPIVRLSPFTYDGCTGIHFPIHTSAKFAHAMGLPDIILQGTATLAHAAREITNREASGDPQRLKSLSCRFTGMVRPGSEIRVRLTGKNPEGSGNAVFFDVLTEEGRKAISDGCAILAP